VPEQDLTEDERSVFAQTPKLMFLAEIDSTAAPRVQISETMRITTDNTGGVWDDKQQAIVIKRSTLRSLAGYAGILLHEIAHAKVRRGKVWRPHWSTRTRSHSKRTDDGASTAMASR
jgi:hypothetical protein